MDYTTVALVFIAAAAGTYGLASLFAPGNPTRDRLARLTGEARRSARREKWDKAARLATPMARLATSSDKQVDDLKSRLLQAGIRDESTATLFFAAKLVLVIALPLLIVTGLAIAGVDLDLVELATSLLAGAVLGFYLPTIWLNRRATRRQREIFNAFPDAVDLLVVCVEAGLGLDAAIARTAQDMATRSVDLADELNLVSIEMRVGATRERALRNLARRSGIEEVTSFVAMMLQADRFGTSIGQSLRVQSDALRVKRRQRAEEEAAKLPLKMLFPLIFFIFPSLLLVLLGPSLIQVMKVLGPIANGG